jgi:hypothetical protein
MRRREYREVQPLTEAEDAIVVAIYRPANPDEARLKAYLADQGVELASGFDAAMRRVRAKGWVFRTNC